MLRMADAATKQAIEVGKERLRDFLEASEDQGDRRAMAVGAGGRGGKVEEYEMKVNGNSEGHEGRGTRMASCEARGGECVYRPTIPILAPSSDAGNPKPHPTIPETLLDPMISCSSCCMPLRKALALLPHSANRQPKTLIRIDVSSIAYISASKSAYFTKPHAQASETLTSSTTLPDSSDRQRSWLP
ncbi:hypothetical protein MRB53_041401 [Persea americana]|nr:hypothetical protein MRB53_041401 [Persea americana]